MIIKPFHVIHLMKDSVVHCYWIVVLGNCNSNQLRDEEEKTSAQSVMNKVEKKKKEVPNENERNWQFFFSTKMNPMETFYLAFFLYLHPKREVKRRKSLLFYTG